MDKKTFLGELREALSVLQEDELDDIINEYEQHIDMKTKSGMTEEEAISDFGSRSELTAEILAAYHVRTDYADRQKQGRKGQSGSGLAQGGAWLKRGGGLLVKGKDFIFRWIGRLFVGIAHVVRMPFAWGARLAAAWKERRALAAARMAPGNAAVGIVPGNAAMGIVPGNTVTNMAPGNAAAGIVSGIAAGASNAGPGVGTDGMTDGVPGAAAGGAAGAPPAHPTGIVKTGVFRSAVSGIYRGISGCVQAAAGLAMRLIRFCLQAALWAIRIAWNCVCIGAAALCAVFGGFSLFVLGVLAVLWMQGYPLAGVTVGCIGLVMCAFAAAGLAMTLVRRKKCAAEEMKGGQHA